MPYDVVAYEADELSCALTEVEEGLHHRMLRKAWMNGSIPADLNALAPLIRTRPSTLRKGWARIGAMWQCMPGNPARLQNAKQESERAFKQEISSKNSTAGKLSGEARRKNSEKFRKDFQEKFADESSRTQNIQDNALKTHENSGTNVQQTFNERSTSHPHPHSPSQTRESITEKSSVLLQSERERTNGSQGPNYQKFWGPVEMHLRKHLDAEIFDRCYAGIRVWGRPSGDEVVLAVPQEFLDEYAADAVATMVTLILGSGTGFLRDRKLRLISIEQAIKQSLNA